VLTGKTLGSKSLLAHTGTYMQAVMEDVSKQHSFSLLLICELSGRPFSGYVCCVFNSIILCVQAYDEIRPQRGEKADPSLPWGTSQDGTVQLFPVVKLESPGLYELGLTECNVWRPWLANFTL